jgi:hypothetical protein
MQIGDGFGYGAILFMRTADLLAALSIALLLGRPEDG